MHAAARRVNTEVSSRDGSCLVGPLFATNFRYFHELKYLSPINVLHTVNGGTGVSRKNTNWTGTVNNNARRESFPGDSKQQARKELRSDALRLITVA